MDELHDVAPLLGVGVDLVARHGEVVVGGDDVDLLGAELLPVVGRATPVEDLRPTGVAREHLGLDDTEVGDALPVELQLPERALGGTERHPLRADLLAQLGRGEHRRRPRPLRCRDLRRAPRDVRRGQPLVGADPRLRHLPVSLGAVLGVIHGGRPYDATVATCPSVVLGTPN